MPKAKKPARKPAKRAAKPAVRRKLAPKAAPKAIAKPAPDPWQTFIPGTEPHDDDDDDGTDYMHVARATRAKPQGRAKALHMYFSDEQREEIERLATHLSKPWRRCTQNEAVRRAFVEGSRVLLSKPSLD